MKIDIQSLSMEKWEGYDLDFRYEASDYYDADIKCDSGEFCATFIKKPFSTPVTKHFKSNLFPDYWDSAQAFGVFQDDCIIACLEIWKEEWSNRLRVTELWVDEKYRRQGIGRELMNFAKKKARELECAH